jgi:hypothetical protein
MTRRATWCVAWIGSLAAVAACGTDTVTFGTGGAGGTGGSGGEPTTTSTGGNTTSNGGGGSGGTGGMPEGCTDDVECQVDAECVEGTCDMASGLCEVDPLPEGTPCGAGTCDGVGNCGTPLGDPCTAGEECGSGFCADSVCCDGQCDALCEACNEVGDEGLCTPFVGVDPDGECNPGVCGGDNACVSGEPVGGGGFGDTSSQFAEDVAADSTNGAILVGRFFGTVDFGGGPVTVNGFGNSDVFVTKLDQNGGHVWTNTYGDGSSDFALEVATDGADRAIVAGVFNGSIDFGLGNNVSGGETDMYVLGLDASGNELWDAHFPGAGFQSVSAVCTGPGDISAVVGFGEDDINFGNGSQTIDGIAPILAVFDAMGNVLHSAIYNSAGDQRFYACSFDNAGNLYVGGRFYDTVNIGGNNLLSAGSRDGFVAKLAANTYGHLWSQSWGDSSEQFVRGLAVDLNDAVVVSGYSNGTIDLGGGPLIPTAGYDHFLAKLDSNGNLLWSQIDSGTDDQFVREIDIDASGHIVLAGFSEGEGNFGGGPLPYAGQDDIFVVKLTGDGVHLWSAQYGGNQDQVALGLDIAPNGEILFAGYTEQTFTIGSQFISGGGGWDAYFARVAP